MGTNRLIHEKSPYLLQHARNPVDWYPWGTEALADARKQDKPIFLSVGYSTCHWCHVMERESFEDADIARLLNRGFISVKVDREERPDIDSVYMEACQKMTGSGGWPLTILMTPEQVPFWAGTYLPPHSRYGQIGLSELLVQIEALWHSDRQKIQQAGAEIISHLLESTVQNRSEPSKELLEKAYRQLRGSFDPSNGGFGKAPKFPTPQNLLFLMEYSRREGKPEAVRMAEVTLIQMARGGIFDQIGGGFSRYSTDDKWLIPHFEKMLYDNALLLQAYLEAAIRTGDKFFHHIADQTLEYVLSELKSPEGAFYSAQDADSDGEEGGYYLFSDHEVKQCLGETNGTLFCRWFDIGEPGNYDGKSVPNLLKNPDYRIEPPGLSNMRSKLYAHRLARARLHKDDKILTSWNSLMIASLVKAYRVLERPDCLQSARQAMEFLRTQLTAPDGRLYVRWREGEPAHSGNLEDYSFLILALLELYASCFEIDYLQEAIRLADVMNEHFQDVENGGFYLTADDSEQLIHRPKEAYDGAMPSGNSAAGLAFVRLWKLTGESHWQDIAERQLSFLSGEAQKYPAGYGFALLAMMEVLYPSRELVCVSADEKMPEGLSKLSLLHSLPALVKNPLNEKQLAKLAPFTAGYPFPEKGYAFYLCKNGACSAPVYDLCSLEDSLSDITAPEL